MLYFSGKLRLLTSTLPQTILIYKLSENPNNLAHSCRRKGKKKCYKVQSKYFQLDLLFLNVKKQVQFPSKLQCKILTLNFIKKSMCNVTTKRKILIIAPGFFSKKKKNTHQARYNLTSK